MEITRGSKLTSEENGVLEEFFDFYSKKETIVADSYKEGYHVLPFKGAKLAYQPDDYSWKSVDFSKKIVSNQKTYSVYLDLCRERYHNASKLLMITTRPLIPNISGYTIRMYNFLKGLKDFGFDITLISFCHEGYSSLENQ